MTAFRDYFFIDDKRLESFSAQLNELGVKSTVVRSRVSGYKGSIDGSAEFGAVLSALLKAGTKMSGEKSAGTTDSETYDPYWKEIGNFIDESANWYADEHPLDVSQLRHVIGKVMLMDVTIVKDVLADPIWNSMEAEDVKEALKAFRPQIENLIKNDMFDGVIPLVNGKKIDFADIFLRTIWKVVVSGIRKLPFSMVGVLIEEGTGRWFYFTVSKEYLLHGYADLTLKHGAQIPGLWSVLGVIDAVPSEETYVNIDIKNRHPSLVKVDKDGKDEDFAPSLISGMEGFYNFVRQFAGRPQTFYAISPLVIYRNLEIPGRN